MRDLAPGVEVLCLPDPGPSSLEQLADGFRWEWAGSIAYNCRRCPGRL